MNYPNKKSKSLYVSNLHHDVSEAMLLEKFSVAGTVDSVNLVRDANTKQSRGFAYVNFKSHTEAKSALDTMNNDAIKGQPIKIKWNIHDPALQNSLNANLFIKNLDKSTNNVELNKLFSRFGKIISHKVASDENGSKGYGYVQFEKERDALVAIKEMDGLIWRGKPLSVAKYVKKSDRNSTSNETSELSSPNRYISKSKATHSGAPTAMQKSSSFVEKSPTIHDSKLSYLKSMLCGKYKMICNKKINKMFDSHGAKGRLAAIDGSVLLVTTTEASHIQCCKVLEGIIHCSFIEIPKGSYSSKSDELLALKSLTKSKNLKYLGISLVADGVFVASFNQADVDKAYAFVKEHIAGILYTKTYKCEPDVARFILKHDGTIWKTCIVSSSPNGVDIAGAESEVKSVLQQLNMKSFKNDQVVFYAPALLQYFNANNDLDSLESSVRCTVSAQLKKTVHQPLSKSSNFKFEVCEGDIADQTTDAIINGVSKQFDLSWGHVSPALLAKAGAELQKECASDPLINSTHVRATRGYNLHCSYVLHVVVPSSAKELGERIGTALQQAKILEAKSVSLPTLGAGGVGIDSLQVAMAMRKAFEKFMEDNPESTLEVKVVVYERSLLQLFQTHALPNTADDVSSSQSKRKFGGNPEEWIVHVTGDTQNDVNMAVAYLRQLKRRILIDDDVISDPIVSKMEENEFKEIEKLCVSIGALCSICTASTPQISISGLKENVNKLKEKIKEILKELENAVIGAKVYVWKWETLSGQFAPLPLRVSRDMMTQYEKSPTEKCRVHVCGQIVKMDFVNMTYKSVNKSGKIKKDETRSPVPSVPHHWTPMSGDTKANYDVPSGTDEYERVLKSFKRGCLYSFTDIKIERIQNPALYHQYQIKKKDVESHMKTNEPAERELFHGTSRDGAEQICAHGFDRGFAGKNATAYGRGTYFATNSNLSMRYTETDTKGFKCMILALVLTGNYCQGQSHYKAPPLMPGEQSKRLYDSVVNDMASPEMFVVFKDASVYPQYLMTFK